MYNRLKAHLRLNHLQPGLTRYHFNHCKRFRRRQPFNCSFYVSGMQWNNPAHMINNYVKIVTYLKSLINKRINFWAGQRLGKLELPDYVHHFGKMYILYISGYSEVHYLASNTWWCGLPSATCTAEFMMTTKLGRLSSRSVTLYYTSYSTFLHNLPSDKSSSVIIYGMGIRFSSYPKSK